MLPQLIIELGDFHKNLWEFIIINGLSPSFCLFMGYIL